MFKDKAPLLYSFCLILLLATLGCMGGDGESMGEETLSEPGVFSTGPIPTAPGIQSGYVYWLPNTFEFGSPTIEESEDMEMIEQLGLLSETPSSNGQIKPEDADPNDTSAEDEQFVFFTWLPGQMGQCGFHDFQTLSTPDGGSVQISSSTTMFPDDYLSFLDLFCLNPLTNLYESTDFDPEVEGTPPTLDLLNANLVSRGGEVYLYIEAKERDNYSLSEIYLIANTTDRLHFEMIPFSANLGFHLGSESDISANPLDYADLFLKIVNYVGIDSEKDDAMQRPLEFYRVRFEI